MLKPPAKTTRNKPEVKQGSHPRESKLSQYRDVRNPSLCTLGLLSDLGEGSRKHGFVLVGAVIKQEFSEHAPSLTVI